MGNLFSYIITNSGLDNTIITEIHKLEQNIININVVLENLNQKTETISNKINSLETNTDTLINNCSNNHGVISHKSITNTKLNNGLEWDNYDTRLNKLEFSDEI